MNICLVLAGDEEGGLEKHFEELSNRIVRLHSVDVIAHEKYRSRFDPAIAFHSLDLSKGRRNPLLLYRLQRIINRIQPDILHAHANKAVDMIATLKRWLNGGIRTVATLHSKKRRLGSFETFDHVIGVSHEVLRELKNPAQTVVYNGIDWSPKPRIEGYLSQFGIQGGFVVCAIGRLEAVKNFSLLIRAVAPLPVTLLIVGNGSEEGKLRALATALGIGEKVIFTGFRNDAETILAHSDLMAISSDREGFSYVFVEALLNKVPIVSTDVSDNKRLIPAAYVVPVGDEAKLSEAIGRSVEHAASVRAEFAASFAYAADHLTLDAMVEETLNVYEKVVEA